MESFRVPAETQTYLETVPIDSLLDFAITYEDATSDADIELFIYTCLLIFRRTGVVESVQRGLQHAEGWVAVTPEDCPDRPRRYEIVSIAAAYNSQIDLDRSSAVPVERGDVGRILNEQSEDDLCRAVRNCEAEILGRGPGNTYGPIFKVYIAFQNQLLLKTGGDTSYLDHAIEFLKGPAVTTADDNVSKHAQRFRALSSLFQCRFARTSATEDTNEIIEYAEMAENLEPTSPDQVDGPDLDFLVSLASAYHHRFTRGNSGKDEDLDHAINLYRRCCAETADVSSENEGDSEKRLALQNRLGLGLTQLFERSGRREDLDQAIEHLEAVLLAWPDDPNIADTLALLGRLLITRYDNLEQMEDLDRALVINKRRADNLRSEAPETLIKAWEEILRHLDRRYIKLRGENDIESSIQVANQLLKTFPGHPRRHMWHREVAYRLRIRYKQNHSMEDTDGATAAYEAAFNEYPPSQPILARIKILDELTQALAERDSTPREAENWERLEKMVKRIGDVTKLNQEEQALLDKTRVSTLTFRAERGSDEALRQAIELTSKMGRDNSHEFGFGLQSGLAVILGRRFRMTRAMEDLDNAIKLARQAADRAPADDLNRFVYLVNLGYVLRLRFIYLGERKDILECIREEEMALAMAETALGTISSESDNWRHASWLIERKVHIVMNLGISYFVLDDGQESREQAIGYLNRTLEEMPEDDTRRFRVLGCLSQIYQRDIGSTEAENSLQLAIDVADKAILAAPPDHPDRVGAFRQGALNHGAAYRSTLDTDSLEKALECCEEGWKVQGGSPLERMGCANLAGDLLAQAGRWEESSRFLDRAVNLLSELNPRSLNNKDKEHILSTTPGLASKAAATALTAGRSAEEAIELLERGRGVIAGILMEIRGDISDLRREDPTLADEFVSLRQQLDVAGAEVFAAPATSTWDWNWNLNRRTEIDRRFNEVLEKIRAMDNFKGFMLPPTKDELVSASRLGPVVIINVNQRRCDALLIDERATQSGREPIRVIALPELKEEDIRDNVRSLRSSDIHPEMLRWLWEAIAGPILDDLGFTEPIKDDGSWPHVWWILTGPLSHLPIHAAGYHGTGCTVLDRVVSSYAPSVKALVYGRRKRLDDAAGAPGCRCLDKSGDAGPPTPQPTALLVSMSETPGTNSDLKHAADEVDLLASLCAGMGLQPVRPDATRSEVLSNIARCKIFHFAGHGKSDHLEPSKSSLLLRDWEHHPLTVADLRESHLHQSSPFLGYLSACSTSVNLDDKLADEGVHLVSAFQLAGFRHVIGTLWQVSDRHCVSVAGTLYQTLGGAGLTDGAVALGLHNAVRELRDLFLDPSGSGNRDGDRWEWAESVLQMIMKNRENAATAKARSTGERKGDAVSGEPEGRNGTLTALEGFPLLQSHIQYWAPYIHVGV